MRGELRAVVGAAEDPDLRARRPVRMGVDRRTDGPAQRRRRDPRLQVAHLLREMPRPPACAFGLSAQRGAPVASPARGRRRGRCGPARCASSTRNCSATLSARVVRQHHAGAADADALRRSRRSPPSAPRARCRRCCRCRGARTPSSGGSRARRSAARARASRGSRRSWVRPRAAVDWSRTESFMISLHAAWKRKLNGAVATRLVEVLLSTSVSAWSPPTQNDYLAGARRRDAGAAVGWHACAAARRQLLVSVVHAVARAARLPCALLRCWRRFAAGCALVRQSSGWRFSGWAADEVPGVGTSMLPHDISALAFARPSLQRGSCRAAAAGLPLCPGTG